MVYDTARQVTLLFGGNAAQRPLGDTWQWDGQDWTQLSDAGPPARFNHALAFDSVRNRTVLFGGVHKNILLADTWEFDGAEWTQQDDTGPSARFSHSMTYDPLKSRVFLFGGAVDDNALGDTWSWDGASWIRITQLGPSARFAAVMIPSGNSALLFGGVTSPLPLPVPQVLADTWEFDGKLWTQRQDIGPSARWGAAAAFDSVRARAVLFGGLHVFTVSPQAADRLQLLGDTWEHAVPAGVGQPQPGVSVESIEVVPAAVELGQDVSLVITLTQKVPFPVDIAVALSPGSSGSPNQPGIVHLPKVRLPPMIQKLAADMQVPGPAQVWTVIAQVAGVANAKIATARLVVS